MTNLEKIRIMRGIKEIYKNDKFLMENWYWEILGFVINEEISYYIKLNGVGKKDDIVITKNGIQDIVNEKHANGEKKLIVGLYQKFNVKDIQKISDSLTKIHALLIGKD